MRQLDYKYNLIMSELFGSKYEGEWLDGWYHGHGKYYYPDGIIYEGNFYKG